MMQNIPYLWKKRVKNFHCSVTQISSQVHVYIWLKPHTQKWTTVTVQEVHHVPHVEFGVFRLARGENSVECSEHRGLYTGSQLCKTPVGTNQLKPHCFIIERHTLRSCNSYKFMVQLHNVLQLYLIHRISVLWVKLGSNVLNALPTYYHQQWWSTLYIYSL